MTAREDKIKDITKRQQTFYETKKKNRITAIWYFLRNRNLQKIRKKLKIEKQLLDLHVKWCGDLSAKKVLDLGCYEGNSLSIYLAQHSREYIAIDLSEKGISHLKGRLKGIPGAKAYTMDFLSSEFTEYEFDLIYAYGVLHHFKNTDELILRIKEKLTPKGMVISNDPLITSLPVKIARDLYRPFQSDKDWEWPFSRQTYRKFERAFNIKDRRGMLGRVKWFMIINFLPLPGRVRLKWALRWHKKDWERSQFSDSELFQCMHLTMLMENKER